MNPLTGKIKLDFRSSEPIYLRIARQVEQLVAKGELKLGDQLPTVREVAAELASTSTPWAGPIASWMKPV